MTMTALVVDDDPQTLVFMEQVLRPLQIDILKAADGQQAIDLLAEHTPHLVFLDILLPHISGLDVLTYIADQPRLDRVVVVITSAHNRRQFEPTLALDRADLYLIKPVYLRHLRQAVEMALTRHGS